MDTEGCSRIVDAAGLRLAGERRLLEMIARGHPLRRFLDEVCRLAERSSR